MLAEKCWDITMKSIMLLKSFAIIALVHFSFFSEISVPSRWKDADLKGLDRENVRKVLGVPDQVVDDSKFIYDVWHMNSSPYWILNVRYNKNKSAEFAVYYRVYPNDQVSKRTQLW